MSTSRSQHALSQTPGPEELSEVDPVYYISHTKKRRYRRLHLLQGCWRGPGHGIGDVSIEMDYRTLVYDSFCRDCWPKNDGPDLQRDSRRLLEDEDPVLIPSSVPSEAESSSTCSADSKATPLEGPAASEPPRAEDSAAQDLFS